MQKIFKTQKIAAGFYAAVAIGVFLYTLIFMTEYKDLFGLKLKQNSQISFFHDSVLQMFNRQIFVLALVGLFIVMCSFCLEIFSKVPDLFALVLVEVLLVACCAGSVYALTNLQAVEGLYRTLDFQYLELEGLADYQLRFTTFRVGLGVYLLQIAACAGYGLTIAASHVTFVKNEKKGPVGNGK